MDETPSPPSTVPVQHHADTFQQSPSKCTLHIYVTLEAEAEDMEEDFQTVLLDGEHWDIEDIPKRTLCFHEHPLPHGTMPILMSLCELPNIIILQHTGYK